MTPEQISAANAAVTDYNTNYRVGLSDAQISGIVSAAAASVDNRGTVAAGVQSYITANHVTVTSDQQSQIVLLISTAFGV